MDKRYWTGKELIEAGYLSAIELGELARDGKITAWMVPGMANYTDGEHYQVIKNGAPHSVSTIPFPFDFYEYALEYEGGMTGPVTAYSYQSHIENMIFEYDEIIREFLNEKGLDGEIERWQAIMSKLNATEKVAAQAAICKLEGLSHKDTFSRIFDIKVSEESAANRISKMKMIAQAIADKHGLKMPAWNIRKGMIKQ